MGKFYGPIGFALQKETTPGVWTEQITERSCSGDFVKNIVKWRDSENLNSNIVIDDLLSIVSDPFSEKNFHTMRYVKWMGVKWEILSVNVKRPRLILTIGGVYNESKQPPETT